MKKTVLLAVITIAVFGMQSCAKDCYTCKKGSDEDVRCKTSNESQKEFDAEITLLEGNGWQCK